MGRYYFDKKDTVEDCRSVSISFLRKHDYFCGCRSGGIAWKNYLGEETSSIGNCGVSLVEAYRQINTDSEGKNA